MRRRLTRHAKRRMRKRGIRPSNVLFFGGKYLGGGKYKKVQKTAGGEVVTIYKNIGGKKIVLTTYKRHKKS